MPLSREIEDMRNVLVIPDLQKIVTSASNESPLLTRTRVGANQATRGCSRCPANGVDSHAMGMEDLVSPAVVTEFENTDVTVRRRACKKASALMGSP